MKREPKRVVQKEKSHRIIVQGTIFTMQRRRLGLFWEDVYRYVKDGDKHILIPNA